MATEIKISVLIINRNYGRYLRDCLDSALNQSRPAYEIVVVDDGSTDESAEVIESYGDQLRFFKRPALGIYQTQKFGVEKISGDWVITLDSDDMLLPHCLEAVYARISPNMSRISYRLKMVSATGQSIGEEPSRKFLVPEGFVGDYWRKGWEVAAPPGSGNTYPLSVMINAYDECNYQYLKDGFYPHDRWLQTIASFQGDCGFIPDVCGLYRIHNSSYEGTYMHDASSLLQRINGHHNQAAYVVAKYRGMGYEVKADDVLAFRYYYWWLRVLYWFASSESREIEKEGRLFLAGRLLGCVFRGLQTNFSVRCSRLVKVLLVVLLPRRSCYLPIVAKLNWIARIRAGGAN